MLAITPILVLIRGQGYSTYRYRYQYGSMPYMLVIWTEPCNITGKYCSREYRYSGRCTTQSSVVTGSQYGTIHGDWGGKLLRD